MMKFTIDISFDGDAEFAEGVGGVKRTSIEPLNKRDTFLQLPCRLYYEQVYHSFVVSEQEQDLNFQKDPRQPTKNIIRLGNWVSRIFL